MIQRPSTPHAGELIGDHWPEIDEVALLAVATDLGHKAVAANTAETKTYKDGATYQLALPEGFDNQVQAIYRIGGMATDLSAWIGKGAGETVASATSVTTTKTMITTVVTACEAVIAAKEAEILLLCTGIVDPVSARARIQQLQAEIRQTIDAGNKDIRILYEGIYVPAPPTPLGLTPLTMHLGPPPSAPPTVVAVPTAPGSSFGVIPPQAGSGPTVVPAAGGGGSAQVEGVGFGKTPSAVPVQPATPGPTPAASTPGTPAPGSVPGAASTPASSAGGISSAGSALPQAPSVSSPSASAAPSLPSAGSASSSLGSGSAPTSSAGSASGSPSSGAALVSSGGGEGRRPLLRPARRRSLRGWLRLEALRRGSRRPPFRRLHRRWLDLLRWRARLRLQRRRRRRFGHLWSRRFRRRRCKEVLARRHPGRRCPLARASPHPVVLQLLRPHQSVQARRWLLQLPPRGLLPLPVRPPPLL